jgi:hypothetical protein
MLRRNLNPVNPRTPKRVAIVLSNPVVSDHDRIPAGFWWSGLTHPLFQVRRDRLRG